MYSHPVIVASNCEATVKVTGTYGKIRVLSNGVGRYCEVQGVSVMAGEAVLSSMGPSAFIDSF